MTVAYQIIKACHSELLGVGPMQPVLILVCTLSCHEICSGLECGSHSCQQGRTSLCPRGAAGRRGSDSSGSGSLYSIPLQCYLMFIRDDHKAIWAKKCDTYLGVLAEWVLVNSVSFSALCLGERIVRRLVLLCWRDDRLDNFSYGAFPELNNEWHKLSEGRKK